VILLSAGHFPQSPGACYGSFCEHAEAVQWVGLIGSEILNAGYAVDRVPTGPLAVFAERELIGGKVWWINERHKKTPVSLAVEIHFNSDAAHTSAGCETLYCPGSAKGQQAAGILQNVMAAIFKPDRGVKEGWYRMDRPGHLDYPGDVEGDEKIDYFLKATDPVALIVEPEFIYNEGLIAQRRELACRAIADAIIHAANTIRGSA